MRDTPLPDLTPPPDDAPDVELIATASLERTDQRPHDVWVIRDDGAAEWAMAQYATAAETGRVLHEQRAAWLARVDEWFRAANAPVARTLEFFAFHLEQYGIQRRNESPRNKHGEPTLKTLALVTGKVNTRSKDEEVAVDFEQTVIDWAKDQRVPIDEAGALLGGWALRDFHHPEKVSPRDDSVGVWTDDNGVTVYLVPLDELGVVRVKESIDIKTLRLFVKIGERNVAPDGAGEPIIIRVPIGPDGDVVPGCHIEPASVSATVTPAL